MTVVDAIGVAVATAVRVTDGSRSSRLPPRTYSGRRSAPQTGASVASSRRSSSLYEASTPEIDWLRRGRAVDQDEPYRAGHDHDPGRPTRSPSPTCATRRGAWSASRPRRTVAKRRPASIAYASSGRSETRRAEEAFVLLGSGEDVELRSCPNRRSTSVPRSSPRLRRGMPRPVTSLRVRARQSGGVGAAVDGRRSRHRRRASRRPEALGGTPARRAALPSATRVRRRLRRRPRHQRSGRAVARATAGSGLARGRDRAGAKVHALEPTTAGVASVVVDGRRGWTRTGSRSRPPTRSRRSSRYRCSRAGSPRSSHRSTPTGFGSTSSTRSRGRTGRRRPDWLRRLEYLQRQLLGGRLDGAEEHRARGRPSAPTTSGERARGAARRAIPSGAAWSATCCSASGCTKGSASSRRRSSKPRPRSATRTSSEGEYEAYRQNDGGVETRRSPTPSAPGSRHSARG